MDGRMPAVPQAQATHSASCGPRSVLSVYPPYEFLSCSQPSSERRNDIIPFREQTGASKVKEGAPVSSEWQSQSSNPISCGDHLLSTASGGLSPPFPTSCSSGSVSPPCCSVEGWSEVVLRLETIGTVTLLEGVGQSTPQLNKGAFPFLSSPPRVPFLVTMGIAEELRMRKNP